MKGVSHDEFESKPDHSGSLPGTARVGRKCGGGTRAGVVLGLNAA